jgi:O-methyltransferase involved in polyketide biosynthesis
MELPASLRWVEADYPHMVEYKERMLATEKPRCQLQRVGVDLADDAARRGFLAGVLPEAKKVLVLTEGVVPYLTEQQVAALAHDLRTQPRFSCWITEYFSPETYQYLRSTARSRVLANAPFRFFPAEWIGFFAGNGWVRKDLRHGADVGVRFKRMPPLPWFARLIVRLMGRRALERMRSATGYLLLVPG